MWYAPFKNQSSVCTRIEGRLGGGGYGVIPEKNYAPGKRGSTPAVNFLLEPKSSSKLFFKNVFYATDRRPTKFTQSIYITIRDS